VLHTTVKSKPKKLSDISVSNCNKLYTDTHTPVQGPATVHVEY